MRRLAACSVLLLVLFGCGDDESADTGDSTATTEAGGSSDTTGEDGSPDSPDSAAATTEAPDDPCVMALEIVNAEAATEMTLENGPFEPEMAIADQGPHPANTVDYDSSLNVAITGFEIEADPQFGLGIPVGVPEVPEGAYYLNFSLFNPTDAIAADQTYIDQLEFEEGAADGEINFAVLYNGSTRLLPGSFTVTITEINDDQVCGEISSGTETDLQQFIGVEGTWVADRIQALEAE